MVSQHFGDTASSMSVTCIKVFGGLLMVSQHFGDTASSMSVTCIKVFGGLLLQLSREGVSCTE